MSRRVEDAIAAREKAKGITADEPTKADLRDKLKELGAEQLNSRASLADLEAAVSAAEAAKA